MARSCHSGRWTVPLRSVVNAAEFGFGAKLTGTSREDILALSAAIHTVSYWWSCARLDMG